MTSAVAGAASKAASKGASAGKGASGRHRAPERKGDALVAGGMAAAASHGSGTRKTSVSGRAAKGAVGGAATGAALGSVVPGVGTAAGAAVGAAVGGTGGAVGGARDKRAARRADQGTTRRLLVAEFTVCIIILALSPLSAPEGQEVKPGDWMKKGSAICGLFLLLGLVSSIGKGGSKIAASFGGLVVLVLLVNERSVFAVLAQRFGASSAGEPARIGPPDGED